jgi:ankyrin repeat protein
MRVIMILFFFCIIVWCASVSSAGQATSPEAKEGVQQLTGSLPPDSMWRKMLEQGATGNGIHKPWMDEMRGRGFKLALYDLEFNWTNSGKALSDWKLVGEQYFADYSYDHSQPLDQIKSDSLVAVLEAEALARAKVGNWIEHPAASTGAGFRRILLADTEWLPVELMFPFFVSYPPGTTALMHAAELGDVQRLKLLLREGVDVNEAGSDGSTALVYAASSGSSASIEVLLNAGAEAKTNPGGEALITAAASGSTRSVELLLKAGAETNYREKDGSTALSVATQRHFGAIVQLLQQAGAHE